MNASTPAITAVSSSWAVIVVSPCSLRPSRSASIKVHEPSPQSLAEVGTLALADEGPQAVPGQRSGPAVCAPAPPPV